ncbi:glycoside hydrolase family 18 protein [Jaapia argillacea MUCL 33604]|uniref:Glycoside hydrolase family 18 protein n=1 Tax=Jaapia argillacea MUCL 33604 TaxID=933084 RepID=A0A067QEL4_9AGAM|nr:glycoside hydrolase family 18 protein [Jaapia argillacea MUCL 33604]
MAYYPDWAGSTFPPEKIDFTKFDWIDFAFALPNQNFGLSWDDPGAPALLTRLVAVAHKGGKKVKLSIGGWTGSKYFSPAVATSQSRQTFVSNILATYKTFNLDGIDIDWEYPGQPGQDGNIVSPSDTNNFYLFLVLLRQQLPPTARISAATQVVPFSGSDGDAIKDASSFAAVLDWILIMNYDVWGSSSTPGPNAPLSNGCHNSSQPDANAVSAINAWTSAGFPAGKIVLGVPSYGYISKSYAETLRTRSLINSRHFVRAGGSTVILKNEDGGTNNGQLQFSDLVDQGALVRSAPTPPSTQPTFTGSGGFTRRWDSCSSTPFLTSHGAEQVITYDDPESLGLKATLAKSAGILGVNMFDVHGDTEHWDLTNALRAGLGLN